MKKTLIVRHHHERTYLPFLSHNIESINPDQVIILTGEPFNNTFVNMIDICSKIDSDVFITLDADVYIIDPDAINKNIHQFYTDFFVIDKFRTKKQRGGVHLYSKDLMNQIKSFLRESEIPIRRPEGGTVRKIARKIDGNFNVEQIPVAYHDFYQYRLDLFYKYVYRGWRTRVLKSKKWFKVWREKEDLDFQVVRNGIEWSWENNIENYPNGLLKSDIIEVFHSLGIEEKEKEISINEENIHDKIIRKIF